MLKASYVVINRKIVNVCLVIPFLRNPAYFSTPNTRTDMYPPLGNLSITSTRQEDHTSYLPFSAGRPVDLNTVTPSRPSDSYSPYSTGVPVTKSSPPKVSGVWDLTKVYEPQCFTHRVLK